MFPSGVRRGQPLVPGIVTHIGGLDASSSPIDIEPTRPFSSGSFLIDTGAQESAVSQDVAQDLGLPRTGRRRNVVSVTGTQIVWEVIGLVYLPDSDILEEVPLLTIPPAPGRAFIAIIGMDILSEFILTIHGPNGIITLARP